ncbi:MAG: tail fiber domain-containing protein, partial [Nanoarchaeota archaeon]
SKPTWADADASLIYCVKTAEDSATSNSIWQTIGDLITPVNSSKDFAINNSDFYVNVTSGRVGIGTSSPANAKLAVKQSADTYGYGINLITSSGALTNYMFSDSSGNLNIQAGSSGQRDVILTGNVGIGRAPATNDLEVEGTASKTASGDWLANSDKRIKTDIQDIDNAINTIMKLRPVKFKYTDDYKSKHDSITDDYYYNYIAQEYREIFPESVQGSGEFLDGEEILQMDSYNAQIVSIKAIQELNQKEDLRYEELSAENDELKEIICRRLGEGC